MLNIFYCKAVEVSIVYGTYPTVQQWRYLLYAEHILLYSSGGIYYMLNIFYCIAVEVSTVFSTYLTVQQWMYLLFTAHILIITVEVSNVFCIAVEVSTVNCTYPNQGI